MQMRLEYYIYCVLIIISDRAILWYIMGIQKIAEVLQMKAKFLNVLALVSAVLVVISVTLSSTASAIWIYQPRVPKTLRT